MATPAPPSDAALARYLLGALPPDDEERFDELSIVDADVAERLRAIEHDLADAYVRGEMTRADQELWERRYLASREGLEHLQLAEALAARERREARPPMWRTFTWGLAAAAVLVLAALSAYVATHQRSTSPPRVAGAPVTAQAAPPAQPRSTPSRAEPRFVALTLAPATRSLTDTPALTIPAGTAEVRLTLRLEPNDFPRYDIAVRDLTSNAIVWRANRVDAVETEAGKTIAVTIPADTFQARHYLINVSGRSSSGSEIVGSYPLKIVLE